MVILDELPIKKAFPFADIFIVKACTFSATLCCTFVVLSAIVLTTLFGCGQGGAAPYPVYFVAADYSNNRVLIWKTFPLSMTQPADIVLGQPDMYSVQANQGLGSASSKTLFKPSGTLITGGKLFVSDASNNRILVWNTFPTINDQPADIVLGQPDTISNLANNGNATPSAQSLFTPTRMCVDSIGRFYASDQSNARVLIWNSIPTMTQQPADLVLGHLLFNVATVNDGGGVGNYAFSNIPYVGCDQNHVYVADGSNHRVLIWKSYPTVSGQAADIVLGQSLMTNHTANSPSRSAQTFNTPHGVFSDGRRLAVADNGNGRVLIWNTIPTVTQQPADLEIGEVDFVTDASTHSQQFLQGPDQVFFGLGNSLMVSDQPASRIMIWNSFPTTNGQLADVVLGQTDFNGSGTGSSSAGLNFPGSLFLAGFPFGSH